MQHHFGLPNAIEKLDSGIDWNCIVCYFRKFIFITLGIDAGHSLYSEQGSKAQHSNLNTEFRFGSCNIGPIRIPGHFILSASFCYIYIIIHYSSILFSAIVAKTR